MKTILDHTIYPNTTAATTVAPGPRPCEPQPKALGPQPSDSLEQKISRLPKPTRDMINLMLEDGLPYKVIIDELAESGRGITPQSLTKWLQSGYEDYLKNRENIEEAKSQAEFAADLLRDLGDIDVSTIHRACPKVTFAVKDGIVTTRLGCCGRLFHSGHQVIR